MLSRIQTSSSQRLVGAPQTGAEYDLTGPLCLEDATKAIRLYVRSSRVGPPSNLPDLRRVVYTLERLYFGLLPATSLRLVPILVAVASVAWFGVVPHMEQLIDRVARAKSE